MSSIDRLGRFRRADKCDRQADSAAAEGPGERDEKGRTAGDKGRARTASGAEGEAVRRAEP